MDLKTQISVVLLAEIQRNGSTTGTCAGLYAVAIGAAAGEGAVYWRPINDALAVKFGPKGRDRTKAAAWAIHDHGAAALKVALAA